MAKSYNGLDRTEVFFAHYGRKGMKRGMNIYNPDYKPIGEKAQLQSKAVQMKKTKLSDSGVSKEQIMQTSNKKTGEAAAKESAFRSSQQYMANTRRERLLNAERQRQATSGTAANEAAKHQKSTDSATGLGATDPRFNRVAASDQTKKVLKGMSRSANSSDEREKALGSSAQEVYKRFLNDPDIQNNPEAVNKLFKDTVMTTSEYVTADEIANDNTKEGIALKAALCSVMQGLEKVIHDRKTQKAMSDSQQPYVSKEYLQEKEYNSKKNSYFGRGG